ncbi:biliverdin-producing heme oxygenase [Ramlibacter sp. USB13]|uniref:Biliverdin-producing heme oxygenase n=1 Tax=Ramlibacter cellulosilyticus TaxID=2764187 RepID=A0A923MSX7_9BURK|nr:biliverdin-producing heme oxygenase [Ramlibacter cellulosilyticus]MBC5783589.1 biliverdin-producing heme oxygenase [Ramlibacter cellulosilyticus]
MHAVPARFPDDPPGDALAALRGATRAHHDRVDRLVDLPRMQDRDHYTRVLQVLDAFLAGWEPVVAAALGARWQPWLQARSRRAFLRQDLRELGAAPDAPARMPALAGGAAAWGSVYVMEGSALGGQFIARHLSHTGAEGRSAGSYFRGWGEATGGMWRDVRGLLAQELDTPERIAQACDAARETFDTLAHLLEGTLHERTPAA